jgi:hypothetical protein
VMAWSQKMTCVKKENAWGKTDSDWLRALFIRGEGHRHCLLCLLSPLPRPLRRLRCVEVFWYHNIHFRYYSTCPLMVCNRSSLVIGRDESFFTRSSCHRATAIRPT